MLALAISLALSLPQELPVGPPGTPEEGGEPGVALPPATEPVGVSELEKAPAARAAEAPRLIPAPGERPAPRKLADRSEGGPSLGGFLLGTGVVMALLGGTFVLLRKYGRRAGLLGGGGVINVLARRELGQKQEVYLVEVGTRVFLVGSTRDHLATLGEFANPDEVAVLRSRLPAGRGGSQRLAFRDSLREGLDEAASPPEGGGYAAIAQEIAEIRRTVRAWKA